MKEGIIDAHTHMFPVEVMSCYDRYAGRCACFKQLTEQTPQSRVVEVFCTPEQALEEMDRAGVEKIVMQGWYWTDMGLCREHNDYMHEVVARYPERFAAYASINPTMGKEAVAELLRIRKMNFLGVGEFGPGGNRFALDHPTLWELLEGCESFGLPVNFHVGEPVGHDYPGKDLTPIDGFCRIARRFPKLKLILAHLGGGLPYFELWPKVKEALSNAYYDLAAAPLLYNIKCVAATVKLAGVQRVLFGTDFPLTIYPRITKSLEIGLFAKDIRENAGLTGEELALVMRENMLGLLKGAQEAKSAGA